VIKADPGQIEQVIMNLVVNARDAMSNGGTITIETSHVELDGTEIGEATPIAAGPYVVLSVSDTGHGMSPEVRSRIFEPFFTTKEIGHGTGLGLSTCYGIVKQSGGHISVYSEVGVGTVFKVFLPRVKATASEAKPRSLGLSAKVESGTILVVEDDERVRTAVVRMLASKGYDVLTASCGAEAIDLAEAHSRSIDLVVSDVIMPGMRGAEVAEHVRARHRQARVLFMSGYTDRSISSEEMLGRGATFIQKPFAPETLFAKVREALRG
jgi:CheY-like chemotaxis protein